ncbi:16S rRNA (cytosine(967)-C(5))-methyltransferase RsmB [soil metagenome]
MVTRRASAPDGRRRADDARTVAWRIVRAVHHDGAWTGPTVDRALRTSELDARDRSFASNLAFQTLRWQGTLDWALRQVVARPLAQVEAGLLDLLRLGAWQLLYGRMPDHAAVSATVDVARAQLPARTVGFANGVLRNLARRRDGLPWPSDDTTDGLALATGYPAWVVTAAIERFGVAARAELEAGNEPAELTVRASDATALRAGLESVGATVRAGTVDPAALHVDGMVPGDLLDQFPDAVIQDEASMVVARAAAAAAPPDGPLLDACAAPGGKTVHLAALDRSVVAADRSPTRLAMVIALASRLGVTVPTVAADGTRTPWRADSFAGVLIDAPCSGLGVVRRRPELRWRRTADDVASLPALQGRLLDAAAPTVRRGGALTYSVCTWTRAETVGVVEAFLSRHDDYTIAVEPPAGVESHPGVDGPGTQLSSALHGCDGMYVAVLRRA